MTPSFPPNRPQYRQGRYGYHRLASRTINIYFLACRKTSIAADLDFVVSQPYPKSPKDILVRVVNREIQEGLAGAVNDKRDFTLHELLSTLMVKLGIENTIASSIIVQLMTHGKVRVDFSSLSQRIELIRDEDQLTAPLAMALFEDFAASVKRPEDKHRKHQTSRIVVQKPRS